jgi:hypothetical protein
VIATERLHKRETDGAIPSYRPQKRLTWYVHVETSCKADLGANVSMVLLLQGCVNGPVGRTNLVTMQWSHAPYSSTKQLSMRIQEDSIVTHCYDDVFLQL